MDFKVGALDQSGNWQAAVWSLAESGEDKENTSSGDEAQKRFFALPAGGNNHTYEIAPLDVNEYENCSSGLKRSLNFSLVQVLAGDIVSYFNWHIYDAHYEVFHMQVSVSSVDINLTCCHPGYILNADGMCVHNHDNQIIVRPDPRRHYIYVQVYSYMLESM